MAAVQSVREQIYSYGEAASNGSLKDAFFADTSLPTDFSLLHSKVIWGFSLLLVVVLARVFGSKQKLPNGARSLPKLQGLPFGIGRFWGIPIPGAEAAWFFGDLHKTYGPIYEWKVFGTVHIWVETDKIARDLLVQRGKKYGDRHELPAAVGVRGGSEILPLMGIGENFWRHKNFLHTIMRHSSAERFWGYPYEENKKTLRRMLERPEDWSEHIVTHCARTVAYVAWGDPRHGTKLFHVVPVLLKAVSPGGPLINLLTFLVNLPEWLSPWANAEKARKKAMEDAFVEAQEDVMKRVENGTATDCWTRLWLDNIKGMEKSKLDKHEAAHAVGTGALVAIVTIGSPLHTFFTAMCHYPEWVGKLQEEVDRVCGDRLPTMDDMPQMIVLRSVVKECLRWRQPTPLGVPHVTTEDDIYDGYFIPKGAMVHANHYLISREPSLYPEGNEFRPQRWFEPSWPSYKEPLTEYPTLRGDAGFGYGPRGCPGIELILIELYTLIGSMVWAFDIKRKTGKEGYENPVPWYETNDYVITMAKPFPLDITPRSEAKAKYILSGCDEGGALAKEPGQGTDKWDVFREDNGRFHWQGLTVPHPGGAPRKYVPGV